MFKKLKAAVKGDKKKKQKTESSSSKLPTTNVDDVVVGNSRRKLSEVVSKCPAAAQQDDKLHANESRGIMKSTSGDCPTDSVPITDLDALNSDEMHGQDSGLLHSSRSPDFDSIFLDDSKHKKGYLNALKKKLTFSNPPKNSDTDTFLCELSTQFDAEMNLIDDIQIVDKEPSNFNFGEKWSYVPNSQVVADEPTSHEVSDDISLIQNQTVQSHSEQETSCEQSTFYSPAPVPFEEDITPPFPTNLSDFAPANPVFSTVAESTNEAKTENPNRSERVRRRRRRDDRASKKRSESTASPAQDDSALRRKSCPFPALPLEISSSPVPENEVIYDVPKPAVATQPRRAHVNVEKRTRRSRANRRNATTNKRNSTELRMHVWTEEDLNSEPSDPVRLRSSSPTEQSSFFERAKKKNYRVSGVSIAMEDVFSKAEEDLHDQCFPSPQHAPPTPAELIDPSGRNSDILDPDEIYAPLHDEVLAVGLAYDENDHKEEEEEHSAHPQTSAVDENFSNLSEIPPPPPPPAVPPPPPPPLSPPTLYKNTPPNSPSHMSVKRINWEKIEPVDLSNTVWGQLGEDYDTINDMVKYLDLEEHFAMKRVKDLKRKAAEKRTDQICLMEHKKAYNMSILLAHVKLSPRQICDCLMVCGNEAVRKRLDASQYKQLLMYAPNQEEVARLQEFSGDQTKLNEADVLAIKLINIPGYQLRLKALMFKLSFAEKEEEIQKNLEVIQRASVQLRKSRKLAKILEFVLAMGNYMNRGHIRISKATGFRIHFLADMDSTKTSDNKLTFLHILARAVISKFPEVVSFPEEIKDVRPAARVIYPAVVEELQEQRKIWLHIRDNLHETVPNTKQDKFKVAMETCLVRTNGSLKRLEQLQNHTVKEYYKTAKYFGENPKNISMQQFFKIFDEFTKKFEKSYKEIRKFVKTKPHIRSRR